MPWPNQSSPIVPNKRTSPSSAFFLAVIVPVGWPWRSAIRRFRCVELAPIGRLNNGPAFGGTLERGAGLGFVCGRMLPDFGFDSGLDGLLLIAHALLSATN